MGTSRLWNRYIQRIRRLHGSSVGYLRTVEAHQDLYPHIHAVLDFGSATIRVDNAKFFDKNLYASWKAQWLCGHSDYQRPYSRGASNSLLYIIKYISKASTKKTIWQKLYANVSDRDVKRNSLSIPPQTHKVPVSPASNSDAQNTNALTTQPLMDNPSLFFCKQFKIKQCTWSRNFTFPRLQPKSLVVSQSLLNAHSN